MATLKLRVTGMSCSHCQTKVEQALKTTAGVYSAIVDLQAGEAEIDFNDDSVTTQQLVAAVERAGYPARLPRQDAPPPARARAPLPGPSGPERRARPAHAEPSTP